jgi:hypothetical protein
MSVDVLVSGALHGKPQQRATKAGKLFAIAILRATVRGGAYKPILDRFWRLIPTAVCYPCMGRFTPSLVLGLAAVAWLCGCGSNNIPEILRGATDPGGSGTVCPHARLPQLQRSPLGLSPEFNERLARQFPPGSDEQKLVGTLTAVGFQSIGTCEEDKSIRILRFDRRDDVFPGVTAWVYWKDDSRGKILWTKGFVAYTSL